MYSAIDKSNKTSSLLHGLLPLTIKNVGTSDYNFTYTKVTFSTLFVRT